MNVKTGKYIFINVNELDDEIIDFLLDFFGNTFGTFGAFASK